MALDNIVVEDIKYQRNGSSGQSFIAAIVRFDEEGQERRTVLNFVPAFLDGEEYVITGLVDSEDMDRMVFATDMDALAEGRIGSLRGDWIFDRTLPELSSAYLESRIAETRNSVQDADNRAGATTNPEARDSALRHASALRDELTRLEGLRASLPAW